MSRRYTIDDLLKLSVSPLICKPTNLPPVEEWMGVQETTSRRPTTGRGKQDDIQAESFAKRPSLLDNPNNRKVTSGPDDIVLGPPRRSFASANARVLGKGLSSKEEEEDGGRNDRQTHQERHTTGGDAGGREAERKDGRYVSNAGRRTDKDDKEDWQTARSGRRHDSEEWESKGRRFGDRERDRPRWGAKEAKDDQQAPEERPQDGDDDAKKAFRRDGNTRAKFEQPWGRGERATGHGDEARKNGQSRPEWRRDRGRDRDWPAQVEADPEWMDSTAADVEEPTQARTAEDFRKWKESMKPSGSKQAPDRGMLDDALEETNMAIGSGVLEKPRVTASQQDIDAMDKFFAKFNDQKPADQVGPQAKAPTKTRFASLFSPPPEEAAKESPQWQPKTEEKDRKPTPTQVPVAMDAEQLAFQQMLQKLTARSTNGTPQNRAPAKSRTSMHGSQEHEEIEAHRQSSDLTHLQRHDDRHPLNATSELERLIDSRSPAMDARTRHHASTPSKDSELLLNLMKQASISREPSQPQAQPIEQRHQLGMFPMMEAINRSAATQNMHVGGGAGRMVSPQREGMLGGYFDDPAISTMRHAPQQMPREAMPRRPTNGPMPPSFEEAYLQNLLQNRPQQHIQSPAAQTQMQGLPPGLQRPPAFDQVPRPPPGWQSQQQPPPPPQPQQHQQVRQPPPGMPNVPQNRGMPPLPYGGMQYPPNMPPPQMQPGQPRPRTYTGDSGPGPGYPPPGMGPPPGFMNSGPPPGFPGMPPNMGRGGEQYGGVQRSSRNAMDLYGNGNGNADRRGLQNGAGAMSGGYR